MLKLSESEWKIMRIIWEKKPSCSANDIVEAAQQENDWTASTIRTLINRLVKKKAISHTHNKNAYVYYPLINQKDTVKEEVASFFKRVFGKGLSPLIVNFLQEEELSKEDVDELKALLDDKIKTNGGA